MNTVEHERNTGSFVTGLLEHYARFQKNLGLTDDLLVEIRLATGQVFGCKGLEIHRSAAMPGCVLVYGRSEQSKRALMIREDHIISAEFMPPPQQDDVEHKLPFGFAAGTSSHP